MSVQLDVPEPPGRLVGVQLTVNPVEGDVVVERLTVPVKPFCPVTVAVNMPVEPVEVNERLTEFMVKGEDPLLM